MRAQFFRLIKGMDAKSGNDVNGSAPKKNSDLVNFSNWEKRLRLASFSVKDWLGACRNLCDFSLGIQFAMRYASARKQSEYGSIYCHFRNSDHPTSWLEGKKMFLCTQIDPIGKS